MLSLLVENLSSPLVVHELPDFVVKRWLPMLSGKGQLVDLRNLAVHGGPMRSRDASEHLAHWSPILKECLEQIRKRLVKGSVIAFDELNCPDFPGETMAIIEVLGLTSLKLQRCPNNPYGAYAVID